MFANPAIEALTELTLDIDKGLTPDISVYPAGTIRPNCSRDVVKMSQMPIVSILHKYLSSCHDTLVTLFGVKNHANGDVRCGSKSSSVYS